MDHRHHRRTIRLDGYDYSSEGCYFVTMCTGGRQCLLGEVVRQEMRMNDVGRMVERWYRELEHKFPSVQGLDHVVMPNHFHCILHVGNPPAGADLSAAVSLSTVVQWFKTMTTNEYYRHVREGSWPAVSRRLWQRNYYEHIIRSQRSLDLISEYIQSNPTRWAEDMFFED